MSTVIATNFANSNHIIFYFKLHLQTFEACASTLATTYTDTVWIYLLLEKQIVSFEFL